MLVGSKTMTTKKEGRVAVETTRLSNNNSSNKADHPNWEVKASPSGFSNNKAEVSILLRLVADGRTKPPAVAGAEVLPNPVAGKAVNKPPWTRKERDKDLKLFFCL